MVGMDGQPAAKIVGDVPPVNKISQKKPVQLLQKKYIMLVCCVLKIQMMGRSES